jgi:hypothetical protein
MRESIVNFGPGGILVGVLTQPDKLRPNASVVVMSNVGLNHRVGPQRVWVELARRLAHRGIPAFRFDVSGLGDSAPRTELLNDIDRSVLDLEDALDWLAANVTDRFELVSLCSGIDNAHRVAVRDVRVRTAVFLDGYTYETAQSLVRKTVLRWVDLPRWKRLLRRRFPQAFGLELDKHAVGWADEIFNREYPSRDQFERDFGQDGRSRDEPPLRVLGRAHVPLQAPVLGRPRAQGMGRPNRGRVLPEGGPHVHLSPRAGGDAEPR